MTERKPRLARATFILMLVGATLGSALDAIHSHFGALSYTSPVFAGWLPPLYLTAAVGWGGLARWLAHGAPERWTARTRA